MGKSLTFRAVGTSIRRYEPDISIRIVAATLLIAGLIGCSSTATPSNGTGGSVGVGGSAGTGGIAGLGGSGGAGGAGPGHDAGSIPVTSFDCGGLTCVSPDTYCRIRSGPFALPDGGQLPPTSSCRSLCSAHDCSCVGVNQGDTYCPSSGCAKNDAGQVTANCGPI